MIALLCAAWAQSPPTSAQLFHPSMDAEKTLWTNDAGLAPPKYVVLRGMLHYANRPATFFNPAGEFPVVTDVLQLSVLGAVTLGPVRIGAAVPVYLRSDGREGGETGLGDVAVEGKVTLLNPAKQPVGIALLGRVSLPTTTVKASLGDRGVGYEVQGIFDKPIGNFLIAANLGTRGFPSVQLDTFDWGAQLIARLGLAYGNVEKMGISLDVGSNINYAGVVEGSTPAEGILGGWWRLPESSLKLRLGAGTGLTTGFGAPKYRVIAGVAWEPPRDRDRDGDGVIDRFDDCKKIPETLNGYADEDGCPDGLASLSVRLIDQEGDPVEGAQVLIDGRRVGVSGADGRVTVTEQMPDSTVKIKGLRRHMKDSPLLSVPLAQGENTADLRLEWLPGRVRIITTSDAGAVTGAVASFIGPQAVSPSPVTAGDNIFYLSAGEWIVLVGGDSFGTERREITIQPDQTSVVTIEVPLKPAKVELQAEEVKILEKILFETDSAVIDTASHALLQEVSNTLLAHPELRRIELQGHTDSTGTEEHNLALSQARMDSVMAFLVHAGVEAERLQARGFGESRPIGDNDTEEGRALNRRVQFVIVEPARTE